MNIRSFCQSPLGVAANPQAWQEKASPLLCARSCNRIQRCCLVVAAALCACVASASAQDASLGQPPYFGWSTFSQQTLDSSFLTQSNITAESDALASSGLQGHGFQYINIDSGWMGSFDSYGRPIPNTSTFPNIQALISHIHKNGQKAGIYWIPGVEYPAVAANFPILGTPYHIQDILTVPYTAGNAFGGPGTSPYHYKIDYTKPGAQEYTNSVVALFASWGVDLIKLDGVTPGSDSYDLSIDNRNDVAAWSKAITASGRRIWLTISWDLDGLFERMAAVCQCAAHRSGCGVRRRLFEAYQLAAHLRALPRPARLGERGRSEHGME